MLNIFNLFLFLLVCWIGFMVAANSLTWIYLLFGICCSAFVTFISYRFKLVAKNSELLYLSVGFYRHFIKVILINFLPSLFLVIRIIFIREPLYPTIQKLEINSKYNFNLGLLIATINMTCGLFCIQAKKNQFLIHAIDQKYFKNFDFNQACKSLSQVNDDNLV